MSKFEITGRPISDDVREFLGEMLGRQVEGYMVTAPNAVQVFWRDDAGEMTDSTVAVVFAGGSIRAPSGRANASCDTNSRNEGGPNRYPFGAEASGDATAAAWPAPQDAGAALYRSNPRPNAGDD